MRSFRFWIPSIIGALITPIAVFAALASTGAGHGSYAAATVFYPMSLLILVLFAGARPTDAFNAQVIETISMVLVFGVAILQFPLYGFILSYARVKNFWWLTVGAAVIYLHLAGIAVYAVIAGIMWLLTSS